MASYQGDALIQELVGRFAGLASQTAEESAASLRSAGREPESVLFSPIRLSSLPLANRCLLSPTENGSPLTENDYVTRAEFGLLTTPPLTAEKGLDPLRPLRWIRINERMHAHGAKMLLQIVPDGNVPDAAVTLAAAAPAGQFDGICLDARVSDACALDAVRGIRRRIGTRYPILVRVSLSSCVIESGLKAGSCRDVRSVSEQLDLLTALAQAGTDAFEIGLGSSETPWLLNPSSFLPAACYAEAARAVKAHFHEIGMDPVVIARGRLDDPSEAEKVLQNNCCDMVSLDGRAFSDPDWYKKAQQTPPEEIRPLSVPSYSPKPGVGRIAVIGAGCRGMAYALEAAGAGCSVDLFESEETLGGTLALFRSAISVRQRECLDYFRAELAKQKNMTIKAGTKADIELLRKGAYDRIVFACTAAAFTTPNVPGWGEIPFTAADSFPAFDQSGWKGKRVCVLGGDSLACDLAWRLQCECGAKRVFLVADSDLLMPDGAPEDRAWMAHHLPLRGAKVFTASRLDAVRAKTVSVVEKGVPIKHTIRCDFIILAEKKPVPNRLYRELLLERPADTVTVLP